MYQNPCSFHENTYSRKSIQNTFHDCWKFLDLSHSPHLGSKHSFRECTKENYHKERRKWTYAKLNKEINKKVRERSSSSSSSTLQQKYSRRIYWPEVDQSNRTARQKMRRWRERQKKLSSKIITERLKKKIKSQQLKNRNPIDQHEWPWRAKNQKEKQNT